MATEQDTSSSEATLRPQTPAARAQNPEADRERTPEEFVELMRQEQRLIYECEVLRAYGMY